MAKIEFRKLCPLQSMICGVSIENVQHAPVDELAGASGQREVDMCPARVGHNIVVDEANTMAM